MGVIPVPLGRIIPVVRGAGGCSSQRDEFMLQAQLNGPGCADGPEFLGATVGTLLAALRGASAFGLLERIREDESCAALLIESAEYTRCEIELAARREMIVKLEDFMRRRSKIEQVIRWENIESAPGLKEACDILFGEQANLRLQEYLSRGQSSQ